MLWSRTPPRAFRVNVSAQGPPIHTTGRPDSLPRWAAATTHHNQQPTTFEQHGRLGLVSRPPATGVSRVSRVPESNPTTEPGRFETAKYRTERRVSRRPAHMAPRSPRGPAGLPAALCPTSIAPIRHRARACFAFCHPLAASASLVAIRGRRAPAATPAVGRCDRLPRSRGGSARTHPRQRRGKDQAPPGRLYCCRVRPPSTPQPQTQTLPHHDVTHWPCWSRTRTRKTSECPKYPWRPTSSRRPTGAATKPTTTTS